MKEIIKKYLTQRNRNIISIIVIVLGLSFIINYCFFEPTYINSYIASNIYMEPANSAFEDENFYKCVVDAYNKKNNKSVAYTTSLSNSQLKTITNLDCSNKGIVSASGVEKLIGLKYLDLKKNELVDINITQNLELIELVLGADNFDSGGPYDPDGNKLTELDVSNNTKLKKIAVSNNKLTNLNVNNNKELVELSLYNNQLINLDLTNNNKLKILNVGFSYGCHNGNGLACGRNYGNFLSVLNLDSNVELEILYASNNQLEFIDLSNNKKLKEVQLSDNQLTSLDVRENLELLELTVDGNLFSSLPLLNENNKLSIMIVSNNQLSEFDSNILTNLKYLKYLDLSNNQLTKLNVTNMDLIELRAHNNQLINLNVSDNSSLTSMSADDNQLINLNVSGNSSLTSLSADDNQLINLNVSGNSSLRSLFVSNNQLTELDLSKYAALTVLGVSNNQLTELDVSKNVALTYLDARKNQLINLDLSNNTQLKEVYLTENKLTSFVSDSSELEKLYLTNNNLISLNLSNNVALKTLDAHNNQLTSLNLSNNVALKTLDAYNNQLTELDVKGAFALEDLTASGNQLTELDVSQNVKLKVLNIQNNPFRKTYYMYKNIKDVKINNPVKIPSHLNWDEPIWNSKNTDIAMVDENGVVELLKTGVVEVSGTSKNTNGSTAYTVTNTINVVEITSDKYKIDEDNSYIFVGSDYDLDVIKSNIKKSSDDIDVDIDMDKYKLYVKHEDEVLKEFDIIGLSSKDYDLSKEYIYVDELDLELINNMNCDKSIEDNKLVIKHGDNVLYEYKLISVLSNYYDIKDYIYIGTKDEVDIDKITVINGKLSLDNNKLIIKYEDEIVDEIDIVSIKIDIDKIFDKHIYIGHKLDLSKVKTINCTPYVDENMLVIKYNNKFIVDTYKLLSFDVRDYNIYGNNIVVLNDVSYDDFTSKINKSDGITYKIYNGEEEITSGNITIGMEVRIYYEKLIDTYMITDKNEYVEINDLEVDEENKVINNINVGSSIDSIISNINTSGSIKVYDEEDELVEDNSKNIGTGWKIKIELTDSKLEYVVSVKGDLNGDGKTNINDVIKVAKYIANSNTLVGIEYTNAADVNLDGKININDAIRLSKSLMGGN